MLPKLARVFREVVLFEAGAGLIFFGSLIHHESLAEHGEKALQELYSLGYTVPDRSDPVRIYPQSISFLYFLSRRRMASRRYFLKGTAARQVGS